MTYGNDLTELAPVQEAGGSIKTSDRVERYLPWLAGIAILVPLLILIRLIADSSLAVPFADEFNLVPLIQKMNSHTLTFSDLTAQHNEHRVLFPLLVMLTLADISEWHISWEIVVNVVFAVLSLGLLLRLVWQTFPGLRWQRWALAVVFAWVVFSPDQWENWLWGWQLSWYLTVLGALATVTILAAPAPLSKVRFGVAAVAAAVADYSLAGGVMAWLSGLIVLFCRGEKAVWKWAWIALAALIAAPYYYHYHRPKPSYGSISYALEHPVAYVKYVVAFLGGALSSSPALAEVGAVVLVFVFIASCAYLVARDRALLPRLAPWIGLAFFAASSAALSGIGRLELGSGQAVSSRYATIGLLFLLATFVVALIALEKLLAERPQLFMIATAALTVVLGGLVIAGYPSGLQEGEEFPKMSNYESCVYSAPSATAPCLEEGYPPSPKYAFEQIQYLRKIHWAGF